MDAAGRDLGERTNKQSVTRTSPVVDDSDCDPLFGVGIGVTLAQRIDLRAEYEVVEIDQPEDSHAA